MKIWSTFLYKKDANFYLPSESLDEGERGE